MNDLLVRVTGDKKPYIDEATLDIPVEAWRALLVNWGLQPTQIRFIPLEELITIAVKQE